MNTEALIQELAAQMRPVRPLGHPLGRFARWATVAAAWVTGGIATIGVRADLAAVSRAPIFLLRVALAVALAAAATVAAFMASIPGRRNHWWALAPTVVMASWFLLEVVGVLAAGDEHAGAGLRCLRNLVAFSVPPGLLLCVMLRRAAPLDGGAIGVLAAVGVAALGHVGTRLVCHNDGALHVLLWHCSFVLSLGGLGVLAGRALSLSVGAAGVSPGPGAGRRSPSCASRR
jgi:hypothetical protein